jgi:hypothetical protein
LVYHFTVADTSAQVSTRWSMSFTTAKEDIVDVGAVDDGVGM